MAVTIRVPYGSREMSCEVPDKRSVNVVRASVPTAPREAEADIVPRALARPTDSPRLRELAMGKRKVVVLTSDHTRPVPSHITLPLMLGEIRAGSPDADITILIGVGSHRATTREEMADKFGEDFAARERIVNHDPLDTANLVSLGRLPSGGELVVSRIAAEADLLAADGFIEPHQFAGFSGGRKSVLPGIASLATVMASHNAEFTVHPAARPGSLDGNPFQEDMLYAARAAKLAFILNVALSRDKRIIAAFAGDADSAHRAGCAFVLEHAGVRIPKTPIVITSNGGYPLDQNIYQSTKSIMQADLACSDGGVIIAVNECRDGCGASAFYDTFKNAASLESLLEEIGRRGRNETVPDQWVTQLTAKILKDRTVFLVTDAPREMTENFGMKHEPTLSAALERADEILSARGLRDTPITVLPDAVSLVVM
ncbi:MAG: nickel-dependent lactate racemase [Synergistaceae bacterium]|jgi:nickel-dependent lactate racemase|nr:nickel-dependent lactate racemase [Synergistaceae bacterium]